MSFFKVFVANLHGRIFQLVSIGLMAARDLYKREQMRLVRLSIRVATRIAHVRASALLQTVTNYEPASACAR